MNFLAHFHLAAPDEYLIAGGLEGDFFKGPLENCADSNIARGVELHRAIDAYTDTHPAVEAVRRQFPAELRRFAGILVDLSFDHFLSKHWSNYDNLVLQDFTQHIYAVLNQQAHLMSPRAQAMARRIVQYRMLDAYRNWEAVPASAERIGERFKRGNPFLDVGELLPPLLSELERSFLDFYPDVVRFSRQRIANHS